MRNWEHIVSNIFYWLKAKDRYKKLVWLLLLGFSIVFFAHTLLFSAPSESHDDKSNSEIYQCLFNRYAGIPCPLCGLSRSCHYFLTGEFAKAWRFHPVGPALCAFFSLSLIISCCKLISKPNDLKWELSTAIISGAGFATALLLLTNWFYRLAMH